MCLVCTFIFKLLLHCSSSVLKTMLLQQRNLLVLIVLISISVKSVLWVEAQLEEWCIADEQASDAELQSGLDWACGKGGADCRKIQKDQPCYLPNTVKDHASFAFNSYFQKYKHKGGNCYFKSAAVVVGVDPSHGGCKYDYYH